ncbi:MAG: hypothetical protein NXH80_08535 [Rhodobacteraceae bacterium]|nr:hypothetical protein [Paracoccaceae bacterium]
MSKKKNNSKDQIEVQDDKEGGAPSKWWQWFFLYPAFGLALLTAIPDWADRVYAVIQGLQRDELDQLKANQELYEANPICMQTSFYWVDSVDGIRVDPIMCEESPAILLRIKYPEGGSRMSMIDLEPHLKPQQVSNGFVSAAFASTRLQIDYENSINFRELQSSQYAQQIAVVRCTRQVDARTILRHISVGTQCYDEYFDILTGWVTQTNPTSCRSSC